jgi:hypothetical protein
VKSNQEVMIQLFDILGKEVYSNTFYAQEITNSVNIIPQEKLGKGVYFCSLIVEEVKRTVKVIIN